MRVINHFYVTQGAQLSLCEVWLSMFLNGSWEDLNL